MKKNNYFISIDGTKIYFHTWIVPNAILTLQIIHGMAEHGKRYEEFARFLNERGISVFATDHRGHGLSSKKNEVLGNIGENGFELMLKDEEYFSDFIQKNYKLKHIIFGHSMGSFICQLLIQKNKKIANAVIFSGSSFISQREIKIARFLSKLSLNLSGIKPSKLLDTLVFYNYNKFTEKRTSFDWLTRDKAEVDKYINDDHCGFIAPNILYFYFFDFLVNLWNRNNMQNIDKHLPIYILSGDKDPVGNYGLAIQNLYNLYSDIGIKNIQLKIYNEGRHEMLNELNRVEVYNDIYLWISSLLLQDKI